MDSRAFFPFLGCAAAARYLLGWEVMPSWLAGVAMSTTSVAVVYAVMIEFGFNTTEYGKTILAACFITDLGTVVALGLIFAPFTMKTLVFLGVGAVVFVVLPWLTPRFFRLYGGRPSELETKYLLLCLLGMGALAAWADSEAVLPAYLIGMVLAGTVGKDHALVRRLRTLTFGLLTPFYFIRAGSFVSVPALIAAPAAFIFFLIVKIVTKIVGVYPVTKYFRIAEQRGDVHNSSDVHGLTFGTISSLFGLSHGIINQGQYSALVATVIASAVIPTVIANALYLPHHLLPQTEAKDSGRAKQRFRRYGGSWTTNRINGEDPMFSKILHANDGSEHAFQALLRRRSRSPSKTIPSFIWYLVEEIDYMPEFIEEVRQETGTAARRFHAVLQRARAMAAQHSSKTSDACFGWTSGAGCRAVGCRAQGRIACYRGNRSFGTVRAYDRQPGRSHRAARTMPGAGGEMRTQDGSTAWKN